MGKGGADRQGPIEPASLDREQGQLGGGGGGGKQGANRASQPGQRTGSVKRASQPGQRTGSVRRGGGVGGDGQRPTGPTWAENRLSTGEERGGGEHKCSGCGKTYLIKVINFFFYQNKLTTGHVDTHCFHAELSHCSHPPITTFILIRSTRRPVLVAPTAHQC